MMNGKRVILNIRKGCSYRTGLRHETRVNETVRERKRMEESKRREDGKRGEGMRGERMEMRGKKSREAGRERNFHEINASNS